jgi:hypothetical protein
MHRSSVSSRETSRPLLTADQLRGRSNFVEPATREAPPSEVPSGGAGTGYHASTHEASATSGPTTSCFPACSSSHLKRASMRSPRDFGRGNRSRAIRMCSPAG